MTVLEEVVAELQKRIEDQSRLIASGSATSFEDYHRRCAQVSAYKYVIELIYEIVKIKPREERI